MFLKFFAKLQKQQNYMNSIANYCKLLSPKIKQNYQKQVLFG